MAEASLGNIVKVHYTGTLSDGSVFDSSKGRDPLEFKIGEGMVIPGFEKAVIGLEVGQNVTVTIPADQAYGPYRSEMVITVPKDRIPENVNPVVGQQLQITQEKGQVIIVMVTNITEDKITIDANHPLAGKDLTFKIELVEIS